MDEPSSYTLEYDLGHQDAVASTHQLLHRKGLLWLASPVASFKWYVLVAVVSPPVGLLASFVVLDAVRWFAPGSPVLEASIAFYLVGVVAAFVFTNRLLKRAIHRAMDRAATKQPLGRRKLTVTSEGIATTSQRGETIREWRSVNQIDATDSHVFICSDVVFVVPRRALNGGDQYQQFVERIRGWHASARSN